MTATVQGVLADLLARGVLAQTDLRGCSLGEIQLIREDQRVPLIPDEYRGFLRRAGRGAGPLMRGSDMFFPELLGIKRDVAELLCESGLSLGDEALVVGMHQGYQAFWIPSVFAKVTEVVMFQEGDSNLVRRWSGFAQFLSDMAETVPPERA